MDGDGEGGCTRYGMCPAFNGNNLASRPRSERYTLVTQAAERRWTAVEKEVHARVRAFARYMEPGAHGPLADGLVLEQRLRGRIHVSWIQTSAFTWRWWWAGTCSVTCVRAQPACCQMQQILHLHLRLLAGTMSRASSTVARWSSAQLREASADPTQAVHPDAAPQWFHPCLAFHQELQELRLPGLRTLHRRDMLKSNLGVSPVQGWRKCPYVMCVSHVRHRS